MPQAKKIKRYKNDLIITEIDLDYYNQVYFENFGETQNEFEAIKNIVVIKKFIDNFKKNNPLFLKKIDEILNEEFNSEIMDIQIVRDFIRYYKIKNEFLKADTLCTIFYMDSICESCSAI